MAGIIALLCTIGLLLFFLLGTFTKGISAIIEGLLTAIGRTAVYGLIVAGIYGILFLINAITASMMDGNGILFPIIMVAVLVVIIVMIMGFGSLIIDFITSIVDIICIIFQVIFDSFGKLCDKIFGKCVSAINKRLDRW